MRTRFWVAYGALALAFALLVPTLAPLSGSMDAFAKDLASGDFRPFGPTGGRAGSGSFSGSLGGFTGQSQGNYLPGAADVPSTWVMDRDGRGGNVVIDAVFNPSLGAMKRLKAYDKLGADGVELEVADKRFRNYAADPTVRYDTPLEASFKVQLHAGEPVPIFSPHPRPLIRTFATSPAVPGGVTFLLDGADTLHAFARVDALVTLNISFMTEAKYYQLDVPPGITPGMYPPGVRPTVAPELVDDARLVLARAGAGEALDVGQTLLALSAYFRSFTEGDIPPPTEVESLYLALATGGHGCCRHRAFAFMVTAQAVGIPTRVVVNEAHAFVEVMLPEGDWHQINLGGCGTYTVNNPNQYRDLFDQAHDPRGEANPTEDRALPTVVTFTNITESPARIVKGERYYVNGTVQSPGGRAVAGARIDVFLNETKDTPGRLTGAGTSDARGQFSILSRVPKELPARGYQLVARALDPGGAQVRYLESWSDPPVDVFAPTQFVFPRLVAAAGFPTNVTGRLVDVDNNSLADANVSWSVEGEPRSELRTDASGRFRASVTFDEVGAKTLDFHFAGSEHHGVATASVTVDVQTGAILIPGEAPTLARGETSTVTGSLAVADVPLGGRAVRVVVSADNATGAAARVLASGEATSGADGAFAVPLRIDARLPPGVYPVRYEVPGLDLATSGLVRVAIRPTLVVEAPATLSPGDAWVVRATLTSDNGTELAGGIVEVTIDGNRSSSRALLTNRTGVARFEFPPRALDAGSHEVAVSFPGNADHADALSIRFVEVVRPWYAAVPPWAYAAALGALLAVAALAWLVSPSGPLHRAYVALTAARPKSRSIEAQFLDHPQGVPAVYEPGESVRLALRVRHRDGRLVAGWLALDAPGGRERARAPPEGWTVALLAPRDGPLRLRARAQGLARLWTAPLDLEVPIHGYRRAVEDGFVALRARARLGDAASPSDLVRALGPRLPSAQQQRLREAASLFEVADYSERPVDRAFYHSFATARRDLEKTLEARPDA